MNQIELDLPADTDHLLAKTVCAKLCHDIISPVSACINIVELGSSLPGGLDDDCTGILGDSAKKAGALLQFYRFVFSDQSQREGQNPKQLLTIMKNALQSDRISFETELSNAVAIPAVLSQILLCQMKIAIGEISSNGVISLGQQDGAFGVSTSGSFDREAHEYYPPSLSKLPPKERSSAIFGYWAGFLARRHEIDLSLRNHAGLSMLCCKHA